MFSRASKQKVQRDLSKAWQSNLQGLALPWLCPALCPAASSSRKSSTIAATKSQRRPKLARTSVFGLDPTNIKFTYRDLASAANLVYDQPNGFDVVPDNFVPFEGSRPDYRQPTETDYRWPGLSSPSTRPDVHRSSPLIIRDMSSTRPPQFRAQDGISGELPEIMQTLRACLKIGRFERAATLIRRLNEIYKPDTSELLAIHNEYLQALVGAIMHTKDQQIVKDLHKWFEVDLKGVGVAPDATTYAFMLKASLYELDAKKIDRTIRRYVSLATIAGMRDETMGLLLHLSNEQDLGTVSQIVPFQPPVEIALEMSENPPSSITAPSVERISDEDFVINSTPQKGLGLATLKNSLSMFSDPQADATNEKSGITEEEKQKISAIQRQKLLERKTYESAVNRWRQEARLLEGLGINSSLKSAPMGAMMWKWHENLKPLLKEEISKCNESEEKVTKTPADKERCLSGPFLQMLAVEKVSTIAILSTMGHICRRGANENGMTLAGTVVAIGEAMEEESSIEMIEKDIEKGSWRSINSPAKLKKLARRLRNQSANNTLTKFVALDEKRNEQQQWSKAIKVRVGVILLSILMKVAKMDVISTDPKSGAKTFESQPVFFHSYSYARGKNIGSIRLNRSLIAQLSSEPVHCTLEKHLPMLVEPKPWVDFNNGAFLNHRVEAVRNKTYDWEQLRYNTTAASNGDMNQMFAGLNILSRTPWRINRQVFDVMVAGWNSGEKLGKIPPEKLPVESPDEPPPSADILVRRLWVRQMKEVDTQRASLKSQRCFVNFQLEVARAYLNETMYFPHNMDFRGRAYPMVPFLNHMNADPCRSLLNFAKGKELGENGLRWLKTHLASLYGYDKASFDERHAFTNDHLSDIYDSATNPLEGKRWWLQADDPWQCLGACIELKSALDMPDPRRFISHLPIHKDGTCNGLQHYAALGGDSLGASQVNLEPGDRPSDIYTRVAGMVQARVAEDAANGNEMARLLNGKITRKVVKQTVMTNVYGVTFIGAREQVYRQLKDTLIDFPNTETISKIRAANYIATEIFSALSTMFTRAQDIQHWLGDCARRISRSVTPEHIEAIRNHQTDPNSPYGRTVLGKKSKVKEKDLFKSTVIWTTPLNMPVVQPYRESDKKFLHTNVQKINIEDGSSALGSTNLRKQLQAFPPNFIHSLDATHMMLTALKCNESGLTFAAVHDSFWTHATDVDTMNGIIRDAFIRMHSDDIIRRLRAEFITRHKGCLHLATINAYSPLGQEIKNWRKTLKFAPKGSKRRIEELLMERRRQELLASEKSEERLEGESMITGAKIYEDFANKKDLHDLTAKETLDEHRIGHVPESIPEIQDGDIDFDTSIGPTFNDPASSAEAEDDAENVSENEELVATAKKKSIKRTIWVWLPIQFSPVPSKGDFDISKVRSSKYFFN